MFPEFIRMALKLTIAFPYLDGNALMVTYNRVNWNASLTAGHDVTDEDDLLKQNITLL